MIKAIVKEPIEGAIDGEVLYEFTILFIKIFA